MDSPCIEHVGSTKDGYGVIKVDGNQVRRHRYVYEQHHGPLSGDAVVRHMCHNKRCYNLDHLRSGSQYDNIQDAVSANRMWHVLSDEQVTTARSMYTGKRGEITRIARMLGVSRSCVSNIVNCKTRKHVL